MFEAARSASAKVLQQRVPGSLEGQQAGECAWNRRKDGEVVGGEIRQRDKGRVELTMKLMDPDNVFRKSLSFGIIWKSEIF